MLACMKKHSLWKVSVVAVAQGVKLQLRCQHIMWAPALVPTSPLLVQISANSLGKRAWVLVTHVGDPDEAPGFSVVQFLPSWLTGEWSMIRMSLCLSL